MFQNMDDQKLINHLLSFLKDSLINKINVATDKGAFKYTPELSQEIAAGKFDKATVDTLLKNASFDVRTDDLIKVFYVEDDFYKYYLFIKEHLELYIADHLLGILKLA